MMTYHRWHQLSPARHSILQYVILPSWSVIEYNLVAPMDTNRGMRYYLGKWVKNVTLALALIAPQLDGRDLEQKK